MTIDKAVIEGIVNSAEDDDELDEILRTVLDARGTLPVIQKTLDVPGVTMINNGITYGQAVRVEDACAYLVRKLDGVGNVEPHPDDVKEIIKAAAQEIENLRQDQHKRTTDLENAYKKQQQHKAEIAELHVLRRKLQAALDVIAPDNEELTRKQTLEFIWLAEESAEIIMAVSKLLRFGLMNHHPDDPTTNRDLLAREIGHHQAAINRLLRQNFMDPQTMREGLLAKSGEIPGLDYKVPVPGQEEE